MAWKPSRVCLALLIAGLIVIFLAGICGWPVANKIVRNKIADILALRPHSESWDRWKDLPVPIQYRIYMFEVENPDQIMKGEKPRVREVGPYVYNEKRVKEVLSADEDKSTLVYDQKLVFEFNEEASKPLKEDDVLTVLNPPAMFFATIIENLNKIDPVINLFKTAVKKMWPTPNPLFTKIKVKDLLFGGIPITCNQSITLENADSRILCEAFKILHPKTTIIDGLGKDIHSFSFFGYKNNKSEGVYEIDMGVNDITKIGQIRSWNKQTLLSIWKGPECNKIIGTDATVFRPYLEEDDVQSLYIYHPDVCRSIRLRYEGETEFKGVKGRRYVTGEDFFESVQTHPENYCYCPQSVKGITHYGGCLKSGALELSGCQGAPVIASQPHFLRADPSYQGKVDGMKPDADRHKIFLDLESYTGYPLRAASRVQINAFLKGIREVELMKELPNVLLPLLWLEESVELTDDLIGVLNEQLFDVLRILHIGRLVLLGVGVVIVLSSVIYYFLKVRPQKVERV